MVLEWQDGAFAIARAGRCLVARDPSLAVERRHHAANFIGSVRDHDDPMFDIDAVGPSAELLHMANIAYRVGGRQLRYDARKQRFTRCKRANALLTATYRPPYDPLASWHVSAGD